jgi:hypothetical protein
MFDPINKKIRKLKGQTWELDFQLQRDLRFAKIIFFHNISLDSNS